ncbi:App1 family protein [Algoriphagus boritolerans]|uniref:Phosphatidate phosphatase APP1 n=1 Tax=Algoriphagus boritolerans DSM 17298 = JCM 18970 TaxID=1120964 RepID=A0A1H5SWF5_9BACT|nr:phosphatase domain-containing protein [Algoriphagus boritolerans]SEF54117.1 Phosphatidate phosphatase APP1 [Algoriphagus boritolerans DSM 17298 = JCM 18970]
MPSSIFSRFRILPLLYFLKQQVSKVKLWVWVKVGFVKKVQIQPYAGYGNGKELYLAGRVLADRDIQASTPEDRFWRNFRKMRKRFLTIVFPGVDVEAEFGGKTIKVTTDEEGYFEIILSLEEIEWSQGWQPIRLRLLHDLLGRATEVVAIGEVYFPVANPDYGIISDIDDTILTTGAMRMWEMLKVTFTQNAHTRISFAGVSEFYDALRKGRDEIVSNPIFYVSSSPWNIYDFLMEFLDAHGIPKGPLMLRDIGLSRDQFIAGSHEVHKLKQINHILEVFQELSFILIGDSGQKDPQIYFEVVKTHPGRVLAVYIRDVSGSDLTDLIAEYLIQGVELILVKDTTAAAAHALSKGWILPSDTEKIKDQRVKDEKE